ncbi:MAG: hypothetical protein ABI140_09400 [Jatrophihabitantaceae bacterium]
MGFEYPASTGPQCSLAPGLLAPARLALALSVRQAVTLVRDGDEPVGTLAWRRWERTTRTRSLPAALLPFIALGHAVLARTEGDSRPAQVLLLDGPTRLAETARFTGLAMVDPVAHEVLLLSDIAGYLDRLRTILPLHDDTARVLAIARQLADDLQAHLERDC